MIKPYFLRCKQSDFPELVALGKLLGVIDEHEGHIHGINGCDWDLVFGTGQLYQNGALIVDESGDPYLHINVLTRFDLGDKAREMAVDHPELAQALSSMGKYFLLDAEGKVRRPANPQCSFGILEPV